MTTIYIKPMTWAGKLKFYVGLQPSNPKASPCYRLGSYFLIVSNIEGARAVAQAEARRTNGNVVECPHYVGFEGVAKHAVMS